MFEKIKENPKSIIFVIALVLTIANTLFEGNTIITTLGALFTSIYGLDIKNFMKGSIDGFCDNNTKEENEDNIKSNDDIESSEVVNEGIINKTGTQPSSPNYPISKDELEENDFDLSDETSDEGGA
ncbi:MAG: hypothetical protein ISP01_07355 [Methanobrevibacter arboriphilus]|uniref:Uncharacterized protein n=1 Tax=Methanobrevibacter arboriphilus TaxID=39441 RepID=A0A843ANX8_METAZ|nr:hypothetical protein [Methanobrevibacter arboriphilus]MBF4469208.1 hypothetical protein [Methanobrevibacter arboriphilus]